MIKEILKYSLDFDFRMNTTTLTAVTWCHQDWMATGISRLPVVQKIFLFIDVACSGRIYGMSWLAKQIQKNWINRQITLKIWQFKTAITTKCNFFKNLSLLDFSHDHTGILTWMCLYNYRWLSMWLLPQSFSTRF